MDVEFVNTYTEVVVENFDAVIKQNLMLQSHLKIAAKQKVKLDSVEKENSELKEKLLQYESDLSSLHGLQKTAADVEIYKREIADLRNAIVKYDNELKEALSYKTKVVDAESVLNEKNRIQQALNDTMTTVSNLENQLKQKDAEVQSLKDSMKKLEEVSVAQQSKEKKTVVKPKNGTSAAVENPTPPKSVKVQTGGFF